MIEPTNGDQPGHPGSSGLPTGSAPPDSTTADMDEVLAEVGSLARIELEAWISARWVTPMGEPGDWQFSAIDLARIRLIREIHHDLGIDAEAVPVVLSLLDQLHSTRRTLHALLDAIDKAPADVRALISPRLSPRLSPGDQTEPPEA
jgi:chaperone modulatory protein CbpM